VFLFILAIILLALAVAGFFVTKFVRRQRDGFDRNSYDWDNWNVALISSRVVVVILLVGALVTAFFSSFTTVSTKNVGIVTTFGHPDGELSNGAHFIAPWSKVTEMAANVQTDQYLGNSDNDTSNSQQPCMDVRIANQSIACVEVTIRWRIVPGSAPELFRDYKTFDHVRDSLVTLNLKSALNNAFADYNPLSILQ
jgi:regulator of protease activity HflC (stomatin/prohibitin superfamily)